MKPLKSLIGKTNFSKFNKYLGSYYVLFLYGAFKSFELEFPEYNKYIQDSKDGYSFCVLSKEEFLNEKTQKFLIENKIKHNIVKANWSREKIMKFIDSTNYWTILYHTDEFEIDD